MQVSKDFYLTINQTAMAEYKDRGSKFMGYAFAINNADDFKTALKKNKRTAPKGKSFLLCLPIRYRQ
jgi:putative IMPACT (imprinted ancient) family translation regulator